MLSLAYYHKIKVLKNTHSLIPFNSSWISSLFSFFLCSLPFHSPHRIIDYTSCLCCVKALFYHCSKDHEIECEGDSISCADDPCSCLPHKRTQRWAWLSALSLALPCLWFYWPMRGCVAICAKCYARHSRHGCRCPAQNSNKSTINNISSNNSGTNSTRTINRTGDLTPEKRLLDTSPEF